MERIEFDITIDEITPKDFVIRFEQLPAFENSFIESIMGCETEISFTTNVIEPSTDPISEQKYYTICLIGYDYLIEKGENQFDQLSIEEKSQPIIDYIKEHPEFDISSKEVVFNQLDDLSESAAHKGLLYALLDVLSIGNGIEVICKVFNEHTNIFKAIREDINRIFRDRVYDNLAIRTNQPNELTEETIRFVPLSIQDDKLQKEVEKLSFEGLTIELIANRLAISKSTVKRYRKKLGIRKKR